MPALVPVMAILILSASLASASLAEIAWDEAGNFQYSEELGAGDFAEVCGPLSQQERVKWTFQATAPLDFNIHYHEGDEVVYPAAFPNAVEQAGELVAPVDQTYCWMWANRLDSPAALTLQLSH